ncbi:serine hydrolase [Mycobacterium sp. SMC-4]|uniref:serine hydrolase n=1 Tax=Mycobacterium sp. SMC-4 TaxID=2857059 RepID=UPI003D05F421
MRRRLLKSALATSATVCAALLVSACAAEVQGAPPTDGQRPQAPVIAPQAPPTEAPFVQQAPFDGLEARIGQATAQAAESGADIELVVMDRTTGQTLSNGDNRPFPIASVVKLFIADDLLLQVAEGKTELSPADRASLDSMLSASNDGAAQTFWNRNGRSAIISRIVARYGLTGTTAPYDNSKWDVTQSTAGDLVRYYDMLLAGRGGLPPEQAEIIVGNLARFTPTGLDGYPQRFGIPDGLPAETVAVKQGWFCCWNGGNQLHVSTGIIGPDRRYVMAIGSLDPTGAATARDNMTRAVKTMFPAGRI